MKMHVTLSFGLMLAIIMNVAFGANYRVGTPNGGWDQFTNLSAWASSLTFFEGDNLIFQYTGSHDVAEVSKAGFDSCSTTTNQPPQTGGNTVVLLTSSGSRYFICTRHCRGGMKVQIDTLAASAPSPSP